jgi:tRNA-dihydrouridine synthase
VRIAQLAESCGIAALAVHGRTREDFYDGARSSKPFVKSDHASKSVIRKW